MLTRDTSLWIAFSVRQTIGRGFKNAESVVWEQALEAPTLPVEKADRSRTAPHSAASKSLSCPAPMWCIQTGASTMMAMTVIV